MSALPWLDLLNEVRTYMAGHDGRFPPVHTKTADAHTVWLGRWWISQRQHLGLGNLSAGRAAAVRDTMALAETLQQQAMAANRDRSWQRLQALTAARKTVRRARVALSNPYLVPGDTEVLQLRIDHPTASIPELARLAGMTGSAFGAKLRGALHRTAASTPANRR